MGQSNAVAVANGKDKTNSVLFISYLCYFFVGSIFTTIGVFLPSVGSYYNIDAASLGYIYTFLNAGVFITIALSGYIIKNFDFKTLLTICCVLVIASIATLNVYHTIYSFSAVMLVMGCVSGILMSGGSYLVIRIVKNVERQASKLIFTDFFFSFAGIVLPVVFGWILSHNVIWFALYNIIMIPCIAIMLVASKINFRDILRMDEPANQKAVSQKWNKKTYVIAFSAFLFILAELAMVMWIVKYMQSELHFSLATASLFVTVYWSSKAAGLIINQFTVVKLGVHKYLLVSVALGMLALATLVNASTFNVAVVSLAALGFVNSGIYATLISYGCTQLAKPCPKLMSFIITAGTAGTLMSSWSSGLVVQYLGLPSVMKFVAIVYLLCLISVAFVTVGDKLTQKKFMLAEDNA